MLKHAPYRVPRHLVVLVLALVMLAPSLVTAQPKDAPYEQDFILTAYYSPLPGQCCYVLGSEEADKYLNGNGNTGADGTAVYPGMVAAPPGYAFGTRISLPGLGIVTVHDRGGAIQELSTAHRLDVWAGYGEEGLARALAFGVKHIRGTVYPPSSHQPHERFSFDDLPAPLGRLTAYQTTDQGLLGLHAKAGDHGLSVQLLQQTLRDAGYFATAPTGTFGDTTKQALVEFNHDMKLSEPADQLTDTTAAVLMAMSQVAKHQAVVAQVTQDSAPSVIQNAQRVLRFLGLYRGRTNGVYDKKLFDAILSFQQHESLVGDATSPGAGRIGPVTRTRLTLVWMRSIAMQRAGNLLTMYQVRQRLAKSGQLVGKFLQPGQTGDAVRGLQTLLVARGFFPQEKVNGVFGPLTQQAVTQYQLAQKLIKSSKDSGAGTVGPVTLKALRLQEVQRAYSLVRGYGWNALATML